MFIDSVDLKYMIAPSGARCFCRPKTGYVNTLNLRRQKDSVANGTSESFRSPTPICYSAAACRLSICLTFKYTRPARNRLKTSETASPSRLNFRSASAPSPA